MSVFDGDDVAAGEPPPPSDRPLPAGQFTIISGSALDDAGHAVSMACRTQRRSARLGSRYCR
ncbi:hypothetical protein BST45_13480 [Mycobacterium shinjukuense]|nr:hypothetical protein BST45_13480 [Mycobacterium shinjukuense]